jgi:hypothetical protein
MPRNQAKLYALWLINKLRESERLFETNVRVARQNYHNSDSQKKGNKINATYIEAEN